MLVCLASLGSDFVISSSCSCPQLRRKVHDLWSLFWSSGLSNPLVAIEQITYLLFIRQLEKLDGERVSSYS